jgi:hypothetical protein
MILICARAWGLWRPIYVHLIVSVGVVEPWLRLVRGFIVFSGSALSFCFEKGVFCEKIRNSCKVQNFP